ncbi:polysaccharide biosynthesis tyrosine autokinase [Acidipropionibacterium jensenii]|uniref:polysaccharide biosynthesis tyrosine autokinase n=1 Tax=Acidipropionibacterium jensenii TaxID=1749 RepID=UPI0026477112|nr:polysaccharide biosynthesis tyrosine autokinase [Acidipropionibacterium jensenii]MDN6556130.1 polysaccharide biosynthesis tyrosine autokinase [Acidipropionibacterium acidipropionici]MDN5977822.1 polysaccharide biosynthesis tyrosine autokinase [Acidipropionibacterium jensenii]MDN5997246.1 polysaccharide biosynthesis tyrosine autokinase [Acidipropionibacterium jensenii]MDN6427387.1 polysaccharide biosynthesis tyrosine autokinase [Acidipropionibacterium jensenii]MDN6441603.1 polysaccharide bio
MTLRDFLKLTRRRLGTILVCTLLGAVAAAGLLLVTPTTYSAQATAYVRVAMPQTSDGSNDSGSYAAAAQLASQKVKAFVSVFTSQSVAESVIKELKLDTTPAELADRVSASNAANSLTIVVTATGDSPGQARKIADAVVTQSAAQVKSLEGANSPVQVVMMAPASLSEITTTPSPAKYLGIGILAGLLIGYAIAFARQHFDTRLRTVDDITDRFRDPVLAVLPQSKGIARTDADSNEDFQSAESLRKLRTNLRYANVDHQAKVILVTSPLQGDGKSSVAASLAKVMAIAGDDVILVDTDLRRPSFAGTFALHGPLGLLQVLVGSTKPENALRRTKIDGLSILPAFDTPPNPSELLSSARMAELVQQLSQDHVVILDAPPVLPVTDAVVLSHLADSIVVVVSAGRTRAEQLEHAIASIERGEGKISGIVLNRASSTKLSRLRYGDAEYGYSQSEYGTQHDSQGVMTPTSSAHRGAQPAQSDGRQADRRPVDKGESQLHQPPEDVSETRRMPVVSLAKSGQLEHDNAELELNDTFAHTELGRRPLWRDSPKRS